MSGIDPRRGAAEEFVRMATKTMSTKATVVLGDDLENMMVWWCKLICLSKVVGEERFQSSNGLILMV